MKDQLSSVGAACPQLVTDTHPKGNDFGRVQVIIAMDLKQLPPALSSPQFLASDPAVFKAFSFRVLRQSRRLASSEIPDKQRVLDAFHAVQEAVAHGGTTDAVREALIAAYVRGARRNQSTVDFEGSMPASKSDATETAGMANS